MNYLRKEAKQMKFNEMPYKRADIEQAKADFIKLMEDFDNAKSGEEQFEVHKRYYETINHIHTNMTLAEIRHTIDVTDEFYSRENDYYDENGPIIQSMLVEYGKKLYNSEVCR